MQSPSLSIVIPAYNEAKRISSTLWSVIDFVESHKIQVEILIVDDGSIDDTSVIVQALEKDFPYVRLIQHPKNMGKGAAVRSGMRSSCGQLVLFTDADGSSPIEEVTKLLEKVTSGFDIAIGSRNAGFGETDLKTKWYRRIIGGVFNLLVRLIIIDNIRDTQCGFKLFTREACDALFQRQRLNGFAFDLELLKLARLQGFKVAEVSINWHHVDGSKINLATDSLKMFLDIFRIWKQYPK